MMGIGSDEIESLAWSGEALVEAGLPFRVSAAEPPAGEINADDVRAGRCESAEKEEGSAACGADFEYSPGSLLEEYLGERSYFGVDLERADRAIEAVHDEIYKLIAVMNQQ